MKKSDVVILSLMISVLLASILAYFSNSWLIAVLSLIFFLVLFISAFLLKKNRSSNISRDDFVNNILLLGKEKSFEYINLLYPNMQTLDDKYIHGDCLISNNIKYSGLGEEEIAICYRKAKQENLKKIVIFCYFADKKAMSLAYRLSIPTVVYSSKKLYNLLKSKDLLPSKENAILKKKGIKTIFSQLAFIPVKYFAFSSMSSAFLSLIIPFKLYYLIFACINAIIGIVVFFINKRMATE